MSKEDLEEVAKILLEPHKKVEDRKFFLLLSGFVGTILMIGFVGGNWSFWRITMEDWKKEATQQMKDQQTYIDEEVGASNKKKIDYINSIHPKKINQND